MTEPLTSKHPKLRSAASALLIAYACHPLVLIFDTVTGLSEGSLAEGNLFYLLSLGGIFALVLLWRLSRPYDPRGLERAVFVAASLFLLVVPVAILAGLLMPDGDLAGALVFMAFIFGGVFIIQSIALFICGASMRRRRLAREWQG